MKRSTMLVFGIALCSSHLFAQERTTGLNNHFEPEALRKIGNFWLCVTLPPGFAKTGGAQQKGANTALNHQGDEGLEETRHRFWAYDVDCQVFAAEFYDQTPLPNE